MGRPFKQWLNGPHVYSCATCRAHAADHDDIISKAGLREGPLGEAERPAQRGEVASRETQKAFRPRPRLLPPPLCEPSRSNSRGATAEPTSSTTS